MTLTLRSTIDISAPAADVFAVVCTPERLPEWNVSVERARRAVQGAPIALGSRAIMLGRVLGQAVEAETEVSVLDAPRCFATRAIRGPRLTTEFSIDDLPTGSRLSIVVRGDVPGGFLGERVAEGVLRKELIASLQRLRQLCESETLGARG